MGAKEIKFRGGILSNFHLCDIVIDGITYKSVEHYYQSQKTLDEKEAEIIRTVATPAQSKKLGKQCNIREDWDDIKIDIMRKALLAKFTQNDDCRLLLLSTMGNDLIEDAPWDSIWGNGPNGNGKNLLGKLLVEVREEIIGGMV